MRVVAQIAPAVRVAVGDAFGLQKGRSVMGKIVNVLHRMGFDEVYDTTFSADLTIMEETAEFIDRVKNGGKLPLLTSCCPAWVKLVGDQFPDYSENVSTCRYPTGYDVRSSKRILPRSGPCSRKEDRNGIFYAMYGEEDGGKPSEQLYKGREGYGLCHHDD